MQSNIAVIYLCRDHGVHLLKQESPESTKLPVLFQPFLRFAEDIQQIFFFCLFARNLFFESHLQQIQPFFGGWQEWKVLQTPQNQQPCHWRYCSFCMCNVQQRRQHIYHGSCPCFPTLLPLSFQKTHSAQKSKCCSCGERTGSYFEPELERNLRKNGSEGKWINDDFSGLESGMTPWWYLYKSKIWLKLLPFLSKYL